MEIDIKNKKENKLFERTEVDFELSHTKAATPSKKEIKQLLAAKLGANEEVVIVNFKSHFGAGKSTGVARVYKSKDAMEKTEPKHMIDRFKEKASTKAPNSKEEQKEDAQ